MEDRWHKIRRVTLLVAIIVIGGVALFPFVVNIYRLLNVGSAFENTYSVQELAVRGSLAIGAAGLVLCVLILFHRLRSDQGTPSLNSGLVLVAIGAALTGIVVVHSGQRTPVTVGPHDDDVPAARPEP
jgi:hypothetical protein